jgi:hypothetical protein
METCKHPKLVIEPLRISKSEKDIMVIRCSECKEIVSIQQPYFTCIVEGFSGVEHKLDKLENINAQLKVVADYVEQLKKTPRTI